MEFVAPESFSQQASGNRAHLMVRRKEVASQHGPQAEYLEIPFACEPGSYYLGLSFAKGLTVPGGTARKCRDQLGKAGGLGTPLDEIGIRGGVVFPLRKDVLDSDHPVGMRVGEPQRSVDDAVDSGIGSNAERKSQYCRERKAGSFAELPEGKFKISQHG
jgi:hypothetical protein